MPVVFAPMTEAERNESLKQIILAHCRFMYQFDRTYAEWAFDHYATSMPWLGLTRKEKNHG